MADNKLLSAECAVLGSILIEPEICGQVFAELHEDDFVTAEYKHIFKSARNLFFSGKQVDAVTICSAAGGDDYRPLLMDLMAITPTSAGWKEYANILKEESRLHKLKILSAKLNLCSNIADASRILSDMQRISASRSGIKPVTMAQALMNFLQSFDETPKYFKTCITELDNNLDISAGDFIIIGGYPSSGKTALALQIACNMSYDEKVGIFSLETKDTKIYDRIISQRTLTDFKSLKKRNLDEKDIKTILKQKDELCKMQIEVFNASGMTVNDIVAHTLANNYSIIFIDYMQLIIPESVKIPRHEQVAQISRDLHIFAQRHQVTVIALSQLSRPETKDKVQKAPNMASLRESGQIEQDADAIMLLYLERADSPYGDRILKLAKNKEGPLCYMKLHFDGWFQSFCEYMDENTMSTKRCVPEQLKLLE